jgi:hypothetical protein
MPQRGKKQKRKPGVPKTAQAAADVVASTAPTSAAAVAKISQAEAVLQKQSIASQMRRGKLDNAKETRIVISPPRKETAQRERTSAAKLAAARRVVINVFAAGEGLASPEAVASSEWQKPCDASTTTWEAPCNGFDQGVVGSRLKYANSPPDPNTVCRMTFADMVRHTITTYYVMANFIYSYYIAQTPVPGTAGSPVLPQNSTPPATTAVISLNNDSVDFPLRYSVASSGPAPHGPYKGIARMTEEGEEAGDYFENPGITDELQLTLNWSKTARANGWINNNGVASVAWEVEIFVLNGRKLKKVGSALTGDIATDVGTTLNVFATWLASDAAAGSNISAGTYFFKIAAFAYNTASPPVLLPYPIYTTVSASYVYTVPVNGGTGLGGAVIMAIEMMSGVVANFASIQALKVYGVSCRQTETSSLLNKGGRMTGFQAPKNVPWWQLVSTPVDTLALTYGDEFKEFAGEKGQRSWLFPGGKDFFGVETPITANGANLLTLDYLALPEEDYLIQFAMLPNQVVAAGGSAIPPNGVSLIWTQNVYFMFDHTNTFFKKRKPLAPESLVLQELDMLRDVPRHTENFTHLFTLAKSALAWLANAVGKGEQVAGVFTDAAGRLKQIVSG